MNHANQSGKPVLTMSGLGKMGRFGNQVFQYSFLRICARLAGARVECAPWAGKHLFGHDDPPVTTQLPPLIDRKVTGESLWDVIPEYVAYIERTTGFKSTIVTSDALRTGVSGGDLNGFFFYHTRHLRPHRDFFRSLFQPQEDMREWLDEPLRILRQRGKTIVAIHMRAGDYKWLPNLGFTLTTPAKWWIEWLDANWSKLDEPVLFVCSDKLAAVKSAFGKYNPVTADDLRVEIPERLKDLGVEYYQDFHLMTQADVLGISNSSFSFSAALLNDRAKQFVRPVWDLDTRLANFDPWDAEPLLWIETGRNKYLSDFPSAMRVARATGGFRRMLATAFVYYPVSVYTIARVRRQLRRSATKSARVGSSETRA